jgi:hypothetical protein
MTFITSSLAVAGLIAVIVPVAIHVLLRRRRTPIRWAAMRFLIEAYRRHHRRLRLEQLLLLFVRCLIPALLGLALARPIMERGVLPPTERSRTVYLVIDDGLASGLQVGPDQTALDRHRSVATQIVRSLDAGDRVCVITAAKPAAVLRPPTNDHPATAELLASLRPRPTCTDLHGALEHVKRIAFGGEADQGRTMVYLLSDFRAGSANLLDPLPVLPGPTAGEGGADCFASRPAPDLVLNTQVVGVEPTRSVLLAGAAEETARVEVHLARRGGELREQTTRLRLMADGSSAGEERAVQWTPGQAEARIDFPIDAPKAAGREMTMTVEAGDDALRADNRYDLVLPIHRYIHVVLADRREFGFEPALDRLTAGQWMRRALVPTADGPISMLEVEPISLTAADVQGADAMIAPQPDLLTDRGWVILRRFVDRGGLLIITPPQDQALHGWVDHLGSDLALPWSIGREVREKSDGLPVMGDAPRSSLLRRIAGDLPELVQAVRVRRVLPVGGGLDWTSSADALLLLSDGSPLLLAGSPAPAMEGGDEPVRSSPGLVVLFTAAPELGWMNLPTKPLMVPLFQEILREGLSRVRSGEPVRVGDVDVAAALAPYSTAAALAGPGGEKIDVQATGRLASPMSEPGVHQVLDSAGREIARLAVNVDPAGGDSTPQSPAAVRAWLDRSAPWRWLDDDDPLGAGTESRGGSSLAGLLLLFLLMVIVLETLLARVFSRASTKPAGGAAAAIRPTMYERTPLGSMEGGA